MSDLELPRLLAIDDSELIHRLLRLRLQHERFEMTFAFSGKEGLRMAEASKPDVILLDLDMPEMTGFDVLSELKSHTETQDIAVIIVSASSEVENKVRAFDLGATDFVSKPFDIVELKARLRSAMRVQHLIKILAQKAQIDGLSGLWNHTYYEKRMAGEFAEAIRYNKPLSLIVADLDNFKKTNDQYGHLFGDLVIERFSNILTSGRLSDIACRYGGEEFTVILPQTTGTESIEVAERYRQQLAACIWTDYPGLVVTASFGVSDIETMEGPKTPETLFSSSDRAMYTAKTNGRNRVEISTTQPAVR
ncbi:MAG: diguanylate cyclase [Phycisphaerales bacterium]|nr:diguanylate cyclase [Phycisphaerales bacterium]